MNDPWMERLSEYLDEDLDRAEREAIEAHVAGCPACAQALAELRRVRAHARTLRDVSPPAGVWAGIETRIAAGRRVPFPRERAPRADGSGAGGRARARLTFSFPQLAAACVAVALVSSGAVYTLMKERGAPQPTAASAPAGGASPGTTLSPRPALKEEPSPPRKAVQQAAVSPDETIETPHEEAIAELRKALARDRQRLDPATIRTLESNLAIIELAIDQAKRALAADPANPYVKEHLADTMRKKVELLQRATMLASAAEESR